MFAGDPRSAYLHCFLRVPHRMFLSRSTVATGLAVQLESHVPLVVLADAVPKHHLALHRGPRLAAFLCVITAKIIIRVVELHLRLIYHPLGYERGYLPLREETDTPFHTQEGDIHVYTSI